MNPGTPETPEQGLARLLSALRSLGIHDIALTGGLALGVWTSPRVTRDLDFCGVLPKEAVEPLLTRYDGMRVGSGSIPDIVRFRVGDWEGDLFVSKSPYDRACLNRAVEMDIAGTRVRVVSPEDLIIHKLIKLRSDRRRVLQDAADLRALATVRQDAMDWDYLRTWLPPSDSKLLESMKVLNDAELVQRLLDRE